jgi:peptide/nickel transport system permease protein
MTLPRFIAGRMVKAVLVVIGIVILNFFLIRLAPGDPAQVLAGEAGAADEKFVAQLRLQFKLDEPLPSQLWAYLKGILTFDLGFSYRQQRTVTDLILERLPATLLLTLAAFTIALVGGVILGTLAARNVGRWVDSAISALALICYATPLFWIALMAVLLFSVTLEWVPAFGMATIGGDLSGAAYVLDIAHHLVLPACVLGLFYIALYTRLTRASLLEVGNQDFIRTARAKGVGEARILWVHQLRNAILPVVTMAGLQAGHLIGGAVVVETVFAWPGIGRLAFDALLQRDYNLLLGIFFVTAAMVVVFNLLTDLVYGAVDPRIDVTG